MGIVVVVAIVLFGLGLGIYNTCGEIYTSVDHHGWEEGSTPDKKATIQNITQQRVQYTKNKAKLKTKISFSDGFYFITHKTDREYSVLTYKIFISDELGKKIINSAIVQHNLAVDEFINNTQSKTPNKPIADSTKITKEMTNIKIEIVNDERYINLKSDDRIGYLRTLKKRTMSELNKLNNILKTENNKLKDIPLDIAKYIKPKDTSSLKNDILKLENKKLAIDELIESEVADKYRKNKYKKLTEKSNLTTQSSKNKNVSVVGISDVEQSQKDEEVYDWDDWD